MIVCAFATSDIARNSARYKQVAKAWKDLQARDSIGRLVDMIGDIEIFSHDAKRVCRCQILSLEP